MVHSQHCSVPGVQSKLAISFTTKRSVSKGFWLAGFEMSYNMYYLPFNLNLDFLFIVVHLHLTLVIPIVLPIVLPTSSLWLQQSIGAHESSI